MRKGRMLTENQEQLLIDISKNQSLWLFGDYSDGLPLSTDSFISATEIDKLRDDGLLYLTYHPQNYPVLTGAGKQYAEALAS